MVNAADLGLRVSHTVWALSLVLQLMQVIVLGKVGLVLNPMYVYVSLLFISLLYLIFFAAYLPSALATDFGSGLCMLSDPRARGTNSTKQYKVQAL